MNMITKFLPVRSVAAVIFAALPSLAWAQQEENTGEVKSVEITVVENYKAQVRSAHKISEQPSFTDSTSEKLPVEVRIQPKGLTLEFRPEAIAAIQLGKVKLPKLPTSQIMLGGGNYASSLVRMVISSPRSKQRAWGVTAEHNGAQSGIKNTFYTRQPQYTNSLGGYFQQNTRDYSFTTGVNAAANYRSYYGYFDNTEPLLDSIPGVWNKQFRLSQEWLRTSNPKTKALGVYRSGQLKYSYTGLGIGGMEHLFKTAHKAEFEADENAVDLNFGYQLGTLATQDSTSRFYHNFFLAPSTGGQKGILTYDFGVNFTATASNHDSNKVQFYIFPHIELQAELLKRTLAVYGGWTGKAVQHTLSQILAENPFVLAPERLQLQGENKAFAGMQGALVGKLQYRVEGALQLVSGDIHYTRTLPNTMTAVSGEEVALLSPEFVNYTKSGLRAELNVPLDEITASLYTELSTYTGAQVFLGQEQRVFGGWLKFDRNELSASTHVKYVGGRFNGDLTGEEQLIGTYTLEDYVDWSAEVSYEINPNLGVSLKGINLLNQRYQLWSGYEVRGIRALFALNYQF